MLLLWQQACDAYVQVVVLQEYHNDSAAAIEAKYVFPLDELSVVCGFEAFINGKHVVGVVKEKETAHREYREAVDAGHGAYLMDQEKEQPVWLFIFILSRCLWWFGIETVLSYLWQLGNSLYQLHYIHDYSGIMTWGAVLSLVVY